MLLVNQMPKRTETIPWHHEGQDNQSDPVDQLDPGEKEIVHGYYRKCFKVWLEEDNECVGVQRWNVPLHVFISL